MRVKSQLSSTKLQIIPKFQIQNSKRLVFNNWILGFVCHLGFVICFLMLIVSASFLNGEEKKADKEAFLVVPELTKLPTVTKQNWEKSVQGMKKVSFGSLKGEGDTKTSVAHAFLAYDKKNFYVLFVCPEPSMDTMVYSFTDPKKDRDKAVYNEECVEIFICPNPDKWTRYGEIVINPAGVVFDHWWRGPGNGSWRWDAEAAIRTMKIRQKGTAGMWLAEVRVPFAKFGGYPKPASSWRINLTRIRKNGKTFTDYSFAPIIGTFHQPHRFEPLFFTKPGKLPVRAVPVISRKKIFPNINTWGWQYRVNTMTKLNFGQIEISKDKTELAVVASLAYNNDELYILFKCREPETGNIRASRIDLEKDHDGPLWGDDCVELYLTTDLKKPQSYWQVIVNTKGVVYDAYAEKPGSYDKKWTSQAKVKTRVIQQTDEIQGYWIAEIRLPFKPMGIEIKPKTRWKINITRQRKAKGSADYSWAPIVGSFHQPDCFLPIEFE
jgi:hypothetical protein